MSLMTSQASHYEWPDNTKQAGLQLQREQLFLENQGNNENKKKFRNHICLNKLLSLYVCPLCALSATSISHFQFCSVVVGFVIHSD